MPGISDENLQKTIEELEAASGGSLVKHISKFELTPTKSILYIGLGGLGSKTINAIKAVYQREYEQAPDNVRFLAVDTCTDDQNQLKMGSLSGGYLGSNELFQIFDKSAINLLTKVPRDPEIAGWIGALPARTLNSLGAQGIRQVGRVMLCGTDKYEQLRSKISGLVSELQEKGTVNVFVIAGISGGTGSGTFIDISYMVRDILDGLAAVDQEVFSWGVFYTPEAQHAIPGIASKPVVWKSLKRNGYAALKELDYFMSNGSQLQTADPIYELSLPGGRIVRSNKPIFDPGRVFLVSGNNTTQDCDDIVNVTARGLLNIFRLNESLTGEQDFTATASNMEGYFDEWRNSNVGKADGSDAPLGIEGAEFPASMNYQYLAQGFSSVYFPRDEIMAYCANRAMEQIYAVWKDAGNVGQFKVDSLLKKHGLDSVESIERSLVTRMGISKAGFLITQSSYKPDRVMYILGRGKVENTSKSTNRAENLADEAVRAFNNERWIEDTARALTAGIISKLSSERYVANHGPFACIAALTGFGETRGVCQLLDAMVANELPRLLHQAADEAETQRAVMEQAAITFEADRTPSDAEELEFLKTCRDFSWARFHQGMLTTIMPQVIAKIREYLRNFNNATFETYVPVMEALAELLNRDSTIFAGTTRTKSVSVQGVKESFGMDAYGLEESDAKRKRFETLFAGYVDNQRVGEVARGFARLMFGPNFGSRWKDYVGEPTLLATAVREAFESFFRPFANDMLEKFAVLAYCGDDGALGNLTPQRLNQIWNAADGTMDAALRDDAITAAGAAIADELLRGGAPLVELEKGSNQQNKLYRHVFVTLIEGMDRLNPAILSHMGENKDYGYADENAKSVARCVTYIGPLALPLIRESSSWAREYLASEGSTQTKSGRHLDERSQDWMTLLPEPFGIDANAYWEANQRTDLIVNWPEEGHDLGLFKQISAALDKGLSEGYVYFDNGPDECFKLISHVNARQTGTDVVASFRQAADIALRRDDGASLRDCLAVAQNELYALDYDEISLSFPSNGPLNERKQETSDDPTKFSNLCRIVRSSMDITRVILGVEEEYFGSASHDGNGILAAYAQVRADIISAKRYEGRLPLFADMLLLGMLEYRPGQREGIGAWRFMSEADGRWEALCDFESLQKGFESDITLYLAFAKGFMALTDEDCDWLREVCVSRRKALELLSKDEAIALRAKLAAVLESDSMRRRRRTEERDVPLFEMITHSYEREYYDMPKTVVSGADVYQNLAGFYQAIIDTIDRTNF